MEINQRRCLVNEHINGNVPFRPCCEKNYFKATLDKREDFRSEEFFASVGNKEIIAIFKSGPHNTPRDRAFDIYLPKDIETGTYPLNNPGRLIEIAYTENFPSYTTHWAFEGEINLIVSNDKQQYSGNTLMKFRDRQGDVFTSQSQFCFSLSV